VKKRDRERGRERGKERERDKEASNASITILIGHENEVINTSVNCACLNHAVISCSVVYRSDEYLHLLMTLVSSLEADQNNSPDNY